MRHLPDDLRARVRAYADRHQLGFMVAVAKLLTLALDTVDARYRAGRARAATRTPEDQRRAAQARWKK